MHKYYRLLFTFVVILTAIGATYAQTLPGVIRGVIRDSATRTPLESATIMLWSLSAETPSHATLLGSRVNNVRGFVFRNLTPGRYRLISTYLGYQPDTTEIALSAAQSDSVTLTVALRRSEKFLTQVVVTARIPPVIMHHDTIAFNADAYPTKPYATVEDLLRKLPGVQIDNNGNVTMQGRKVDKIYLDGEEFFLNDPRLATKNLPADIVDQIEVFNSQTERARLTGIHDATGAKSINLKLKSNRRYGIFGKGYAGTGTGAPSNPSSPIGVYSAGGMATSLVKSWTFATANVNDINNQFTGEENNNGPGGGGTQTLQNFELNYKHFDRYNASVPGSGQRNPKGYGKLLSFTVNARTNSSRTLLNQTSSTLTALNDSSLLQNRSSRSLSNNRYTNGDVYLEYRFDNANFIGVWNSIADISYGFPLANQLKGNGSLRLHGSYSRNVSLSNGLPDVTGTLG